MEQWTYDSDRQCYVDSSGRNYSPSDLHFFDERFTFFDSELVGRSLEQLLQEKIRALSKKSLPHTYAAIPFTGGVVVDFFSVTQRAALDYSDGDDCLDADPNSEEVAK